MSNIVFLDVQGFQYKKSEFLCKELAFKKENGEIKHFIFNFIIGEEHLNADFAKQIKWLRNNIHGFEWYDKGAQEYTSLCRILQEIEPNSTIYVKGLQKVNWLKKFLSGPWNIIDVETFNCPKLSTLRLVSKVHCMQHRDNTLQCAYENVHLIADWMESIKATNPQNFASVYPKMSVYYAMDGYLKPLNLNDLKELINCFRYNDALDALHDIEDQWAETGNNQPDKSCDLTDLAHTLQFGEDSNMGADVL